MNLASFIDNIEARAAETIKAERDDYIGEDGLLYCGKCHTRKQTRVKFLGVEKTPYCLCKCEIEKREREENERKRIAFLNTVAKIRREGFPESDMQNWSFDKADGSNDKLMNAAKKYAQNFDEFRENGKGLLLFGTVGTGKTYAAACIANALIDKGVPVLMTNFARIANTVGGMWEGKQEYYDSLNRYPLLILDDLAAERKTEYMSEIVFNVIDSRYRAGLPLIVTTNLTSEELKHPSDRLAESYHERARRGVAFEADLSKVDKKYHATYKRAAESGILNNTRRTHEFVDFLARLEADKGVTFDFLNNEKLKGTRFARDDAFVNGYYDRANKKIGVNIDSAKAWQTTVGHEVTHVLEGTELYKELKDVLFKYAEAKGELKSRREALAQLYDEADIDTELAADLVGDYLFTDKDFVANLSTTNKNLFKKLWDEVKYLYKIATAGSKEKRQLEKVKKAFEDAYKADTKASTESKVQHSVGYHAGDLGKSESLGMQSGGRDTGHYGTGTYFVGNEAEISDSTYGKRPHEKVEFDKYNLFKPKTADNAGKLHDFLKGVNYYYNRDTNLVSTDEEIEAIKERVDELSYDELTADTFEQVIELVTKVAGKDRVSNALWSYLGDVSQGGDGTFYNGDKPMSTREVAETIADKDSAAYKLQQLLDDGYVVRPIWRFQEWNESIAEAAEMLGVSEERARQIISDIKAEIDAAGYNYKTAYTADSASTRFMKALGYEGVDVRGIKQYDNTMYGSVIYDLKGEDAKRKAEIGTAKFSLSDNKSLDKNSQMRYNTTEWASDNNILTAGQMENFYSRFSAVTANLETAEGGKTKSGEYMIPVSDIYDNSKEGVRNAIVFASGTLDDHVVTAVIEIDLDNETDLSEAREEVYETERRGIPQKTTGIFRRYNSFDFTNSRIGQRGLRKGEGYNNQFGANRGRSGDGAREAVSYRTTEEGYKVYDLTPYEASSNDDVFFDEETWQGEVESLYATIMDGVSDSVKEWMPTLNEVLAAKRSRFGSFRAAERMLERVLDGLVAGEIPTYAEFKKLESAAIRIEKLSAAKEKATSDSNVRFSLSKPVEETKDLVAMHNVRADKLTEALRLGGLPAPSIAITKKDLAHENYGDITLLLRKDSIDPQADSRNKVYGSDAWTPTSSNARTEYEVDANKARAFEDRLEKLSQRVAGGAFARGSMVRAMGIDDTSDQNAKRLAERLANYDEVRAAYLADTGKTVEPEYKKKEYSKFGNAALQKYIDRVGAQRLASIVADSYEGDMASIEAEEEAVKQIIRDAYIEKHAYALNKRPDLKDIRVNLYMDKNVNAFTVEDFINEAWEFYQDGGAVTEEIDRLATSDKLRSAVNDADVRAWLEPQIAEFLGEPGIYNGKDPFYSDGRRRSFAETHYTYTAENIVKAMQNASARGEGTFGANANSIIATATPSYNSIEEIRADKGRLKVEDGEVYGKILSNIENTLTSIERDIMRTTKHHADNTFDEEQIIGSIITEAATGARTVAAVQRAFAKEDYKISTEQAKKILDLYNEAANVPTGYFEAKPERVVGFDEVAAFIIPNNTDIKLKQELLNRGYTIAEYDPTIEGSRQKVVNQFEDYAFSLSDANETPKRYGNYYTPASDLRFDAPIAEDVAPVQDSAQDSVQDSADNLQNVAPEGFAPVTEDESNALARDNLASLTDEDAPPEAEAPYYAEDITPNDPFENRDIKAVGNRKIKAYMYENPEVKPFFQEEANIMLGELMDTTKGEKIYTPTPDGHLDEYGGMVYGSDSYGIWSGTKRHTTDDIAYLLDEQGYTYAEIEKGLKAIIEDNGAENNACSKRIEFLLNDRLMNGYRDLSGYEIPANQDYINLLNEKQITEYNEEARKSFFESVGATKTAPIADDIAPIAEQYEAIRPPKQSAEPRMKRVTSEDIAPDTAEPPKVAKVLESTPKEQKKVSLTRKVRELLVDKQSSIEDLSLKTKNRELMAKADFMLRSESRAQRHIKQKLMPILEQVEATGNRQAFEEYAYHLHNIDRMSIESNAQQRIAQLQGKFGHLKTEQIKAIAAKEITDKTTERTAQTIREAKEYLNALEAKNKPVFGDIVTADVSREAVKRFEAENPGARELADALIEYNNELRQILVDGNVISQETADLWAKEYPHYVPIRRAGKDGAAVSVALDTKRTGVDAPIKRATGGNSDMESLLDTMASRTEQVFRAIARNNFGLELMHTLDTVVDTKPTSIDEILDTFDEGYDELLKKGENGANPTFTVFEDGKRVTFDITEELYDALKPTNELFKTDVPIMGQLTKIQRGLLTQYNPTFIATNAIKDIQDVIVNSQHPAATYANVPTAIKELISGKSKWISEYMDNGGEDLTYFDSKKKVFKKEDGAVKKVLGFVPGKIAQANDFVEKIPRLAEYIASRKKGASIEVAMLDAARVTTNFAAGGDLTKFANRNGFTFLNASVQGFNQQVRNVREAKANGLKGIMQLAAKVAIAGLPVMLLNHLLWEDDEEYEELSDYVKDNYYIVAKTEDGKFVRIPKGRTVAVIQSGLEQMKNQITGDDEVDMARFGQLMVENLAPNNPLDNNVLAPMIQAASNRTWYGGDLVPTRLQDMPDAEQYDETTDSISKWLGENVGGSPYKWNYLLDQYSGGVGDVVLPMLTPESDGQGVIAPWSDKFTTDSTMKNQNVSDFYDTVDELTKNANSMHATDKDTLSYKYMNSVSAELGELYAKKREIQNSDLTDAEKDEAVREIQEQINSLARESLDTYGNVRIDGPYATVGDRHYRWYEPGEDSEAEAGWQKISDKQLEKQEEVTSGLGISASEYWSNKEEYDYAYDNPGNYAVAKAVGGYSAYRSYAGELYDIKADKDSSGKSIVGSRKEKVIEYVNNLDIDYGERLILFKSEYNADDTYNYQIIDYLNNRDDISYDEMVAILKELGFTVDSNGNIYWD